MKILIGKAYWDEEIGEWSLEFNNKVNLNGIDQLDCFNDLLADLSSFSKEGHKKFEDWYFENQKKGENKWECI